MEYGCVGRRNSRGRLETNQIGRGDNHRSLDGPAVIAAGLWTLAFPPRQQWRIKIILGEALCTDLPLLLSRPSRCCAWRLLPCQLAVRSPNRNSSFPSRFLLKTQNIRNKT